MKTYRARLAGSSEVRAQCSTATRRHVTMALLGYTVPAFLFGIGVERLLESGGVDVPSRTSIGIGGVIILAALWRGGTVEAAVRPDGIRVRNRWRQLVVPWNEIIAVEFGQSVSYGLFDFVDEIRDLAGNGGSNLTVDEDLQFSFILRIRRRGRRWRVPVYATLGFALHPIEMGEFLDAIAAHGITVTSDRPSSSVPPPPDSAAV